MAGPRRSAWYLPRGWSTHQSRLATSRGPRAKSDASPRLNCASWELQDTRAPGQPKIIALVPSALEMRTLVRSARFAAMPPVVPEGTGAFDVVSGDVLARILLALPIQDHCFAVIRWLRSARPLQRLRRRVCVCEADVARRATRCASSNSRRAASIAVDQSVRAPSYDLVQWVGRGAGAANYLATSCGKGLPSTSGIVSPRLLH